MKTLFAIFALLTLAPYANAQATNPQNTFSNAVNVNSPSLRLNFNDATTAFTDSVSQLSFGGANATSNTIITPTLPFSIQYIAFNAQPLQPGSLISVSIQFPTGCVPTAGQSVTFVIGNAPGSSIAIQHSFTVSVASTTAIQTFTAPANFTAIPVSSGEILGAWAASGCSVGYESGGGGLYYSSTTYSTLPSGAVSYNLINTDSSSISGVVATTSPGTIAPRQPGFDNTNNANYSASFPYNAWSAAPNNSLGAIDWNVPWTMLLHVDRLNWDHNGTLTFASKGDVQGCTGSGGCGSTGNWWRLFLQPTGFSSGSQLCFERNGKGQYQAQQVVCTNTYDGMPNGFNYDIVIEDAGTGLPGSLSMYINGSSVLQSANNTTYGNGFGNVLLTVTGGTGYANSTSFTSTGGGPNCTVTGVMTASGGVPTVIAAYNTGETNAGCTSNPTIVLTSPTGTGAVITATAAPMSMNSTTSPLMVPGYVSNGTYYGAGSTDTSENPIYIDEFAIFPGNLSFGQVTNLFYTTKFYQSLLYPYATPPVVVFDSCCCGPDFSGDQTLAMTIGAAKAGLIKLAGMVDNDGNPNGENSVGWWRQMLDEAGLNDVGVSVGPGSPTANIGGCPAANITAYNASTPQNASAYESSVTMYRTIFAKYPTTPVYVLVTQDANGYAAFVTSPADSISPLTGLQLQAQNAANGGYVNLFQGNLGLTPTALQTVLTNNGSLPIYIFGGSPAKGGPGVLASRTSNDPLYMTAAAMGGDSVSGWTNQQLAQVLSPYFYGGVTVNYSGGTGYANSTPFTSTGGGPYCHVTGIMTASGGVPNGIETSWGASFPPTSTYNGLGYGCMSAPTLVLTNPTGAGVTLTATSPLALTCYGPSGCTNQYVLWPNQYAQAPGGVWTAPVFTWFQNSLMDPPPNGAPRPY